MVATAILSMGTVMLYHSFFICADAVTYASNRLNAQLWAENKLGQAREAELGNRTLAGESPQEAVFFNGRSFRWEETVSPIEGNLSAVTLTLFWKEAAKNRTLSYATYLNEPTTNLSQ
jgi:hypothetical protein